MVKHIQSALQTTARSVIIGGLVLVLVGCAGYYRDSEKRTLGQATDDTAIQTVLKTRLMDDPWVDGLQINTDVYKGVVTLDGMVDSKEEYRRAIKIAQTTRGVRKVVDKLTLNPYATN